MTDEDNEPRYMSCFRCKVSELITDDYDFAGWIAAHPLHPCRMGSEPIGQASLF